MLSMSLTNIILPLIIHWIDVCHTLIDPTIAMCIDGEVNTAAVTQDGSTYIFMNSWFWKLNQTLDGVDGKARNISKEWRHLSPNVETSFYISYESSRLNGKTFFIQDKNWFQFHNRHYEEQGSIDNWTGIITSRPLVAVSKRMDPMVVFYVKHSKNIRPHGYNFDSPYFPESMTVLRDTLPITVHEMVAVVHYPDDRYLLFVDDRRIGSHCLMKGADSRCSDYRLNRDLFECPENTKHLFKKNLLIRTWYWSGMRLKQFGILLLGILVSILLILLFMLFFIGSYILKTIQNKCQN